LNWRVLSFTGVEGSSYVQFHIPDYLSTMELEGDREESYFSSNVRQGLMEPDNQVDHEQQFHKHIAFSDLVWTFRNAKGTNRIDTRRPAGIQSAVLERDVWHRK